MSIYDDRPIGDIYVEWANTLDTAGTDSGPARERLMTVDTVVKMKSMMNDIMWASERADHVKKFVFYGKEGVMGKIKFDSEEMHVMGQNTMDAVMARLNDHEFVRLLHAVLGHASEIGEMVEALYKYIYVGVPIDKENIAEEFGDGMWYDALAAKYLGFLTFNEFMAGNRAKLIERYGENWTQDSALNRDTAAEMKALSGATDLSAKQPTTYGDSFPVEVENFLELPEERASRQNKPFAQVYGKKPISETGTCPYCFHNWHEGKRCGVLPLGSTEGCECEGKR